MIKLLSTICLIMITLSSYVSASKLLLLAKGEKKIYRSLFKKQLSKLLSDYFLFVAITYLCYRAIYYFEILDVEAAIFVALGVGAIYLLFKTPALEIKELCHAALLIDLVICLLLCVSFAFFKSEDYYVLSVLAPLVPFILMNFTSFKQSEDIWGNYQFDLKDTTLIVLDESDEYLKWSLEDQRIKAVSKNSEALIPYLYLSLEEFDKYKEAPFKRVIDLTTLSKSVIPSYVYSKDIYEDKTSFGFESSALPLEVFDYSFKGVSYRFLEETGHSENKYRILIALKCLLSYLDGDNFKDDLKDQKGYMSSGLFEGINYLDDSKAQYISSDLITFIKDNSGCVLIIEAYEKDNERLNEVISNIEHILVIDGEYTKTLGQSLNRAGYDMERFTLVKDLKEALKYISLHLKEDDYFILEHITNH